MLRHRLLAGEPGPEVSGEDAGMYVRLWATVSKLRRQHGSGCRTGFVLVCVITAALQTVQATAAIALGDTGTRTFSLQDAVAIALAPDVAGSAC